MGDKKLWPLSSARLGYASKRIVSLVMLVFPRSRSIVSQPNDAASPTFRTACTHYRRFASLRSCGRSQCEKPQTPNLATDTSVRVLLCLQDALAPCVFTSDTEEGHLESYCRLLHKYNATTKFRAWP